MIDLHQGDCLEVMDMLIAQGIQVDAIITDPPYGTTACKRDSVIPFEAMRSRLNKLIKPNGAIVLTASQPFTSALVMSNVNMFKYNWVWKKSKITGVLNAKKQPVRQHEDILVFYKKQSTYNPQGLVRVDKMTKQGGNSDNYGKRNTDTYLQEFTNYPRTVLEISSEGKTLHPTQKPVALIEYLIKTYTNEGETVLDFTMGSGTTGVACRNTNRSFIGIELDSNYFKIASDRINNKMSTNLFDK